MIVWYAEVREVPGRDEETDARVVEAVDGRECCDAATAGASGEGYLAVGSSMDLRADGGANGSDADME